MEGKKGGKGVENSVTCWERLCVHRGAQCNRVVGWHAGLATLWGLMVNKRGAVPEQVFERVEKWSSMSRS